MTRQRQADALRLIALLLALTAIAVFALHSMKVARDRAAKALTASDKLASAKLATELKVTIGQVRWADQVPWSMSQSILSVICENLSGKPLFFVYDIHSLRKGPAGQLSFKVYDDKDQQMPLTTYGKLLQQPESSGGRLREWTGHTLPAHASVTYYADLSCYVDVSKPGNYTVTATFSPANPTIGGSVTSNTIQVEIDSDGLIM